jgi:hypothetical protein
MFATRRATTSKTRAGVFEAVKRARATVAAGVALILVSPFLSVVPAQAATLVPVVVDLSKTTSAPVVGTAVAGETVTFDYTVTCSSTQTDCVNLTLTDSFPAPLVFDSVNTNSNYSIASTTNGFVLNFTNPLDEGGVGLVAGETVSFQAIGHVASDVDAVYDGVTVVNTVYATVDNPDSNVEASAPVGIIAPLVVASSITKSVSPSTLTGFVGTPVTFTLTATNTTNSTVDVMTVSDPAEAALPTNAYEYLDVTGLSVVFPSGANRVRIDRYTGTAWVNGSVSATATLPSGTIKGLRFTFTNSNPAVDIARGATATITINTVTNASVEDLTTPFNGLNIASSQVERATTLGTIVSANAPFTINPAALNPVATKSFSSSDVVGGETLTATLGAQNGGDFTLTELEIVEPQPGTASFADQGFEFVSINQAQVFWPTGATSVTVTYEYEDGVAASPITRLSPRDSLPEPDIGRTVIGLTATFAGSIAPGQYATVPFTIQTLATASDATTTNTLEVHARTADKSASTTASDDLLRRSSRLSTSITKLATPDEVFATGIAPILVSLQAQIDPRPTHDSDTGGSTIGATQFVVTDDDARFWNIANPSNIVATEIPVGSTLQILYSIDGGLTYPVSQQLLAPTAGPGIINLAIPSGLVESINGISFVYTPTAPGTLLQPGFNVQPNIKVRIRATERTSGDPLFAPGATDARVIDNTAITFVENIDAGLIDTAMDTEPVTVQPAPADGGPGYAMIDKSWVEDELLARSSQLATARVDWGTAGQEYATVVVSDTPNPSAATVAATVYDAFDLYSIAPITTAGDPLIRFDSIIGVEYYSASTGAWLPLGAASSLCTLAPCNGSFPGYTLTPAERADAIGVRFVFAENPGREQPTQAGDPVPGTGVAATVDTNRQLSLTFQLRMVLRSDESTAVLGVTRGQLYNTGNPGEVDNTAGVEGRDELDAVLWSEQASDDILILDGSLNVVATKDWVDGPLGVPPVGTAQSLFPTALMTVTAQNASVVPVNELRLVEPTGTTNPFEYLNLTKIEKLTGSTDTSSTAVLEYSDGSFSAEIGINALVAMTAAQLVDVVGLTLSRAGPVAVGETIGLQLHTQLREFERTSGLRVTPMTVHNEVTASVIDPSGTTTPPVSTAPNNVVSDLATATLAIEEWSYGVVANKTISTETVEYGSNASTSTTGVSASSDGLTPEVHGLPQTAAIQYDNGEAMSRRATVTVSGQPTGNVRTTDIVLVDATPTFWNVYNLVSIDTAALADSRKRVQVDVLIGSGSWGYGVEYDDSAGLSSSCTPGPTTDCWILGTAASAPALPSTMPAGSQVTDIRGLRFTFTNADGSAWERPYNPPVTALFTVERRSVLVSDPAEPVPSTLFTYTGPTPGESVQGIFTNTVEVTASARASAGSAALWTASADATAEIRYQHLPARVKVKKSPTGAQSLNTDIPYKIAITNTGGDLDRPLGEIVVTDSLPVNTFEVPAKSMLVVPNDADDQPQSVTAVTTIRVSDASNATLPSPSFTATLLPVDGDHQDIIFDFDDAWVLPRLATLTITVNLQFSPMLEAGTEVINTATVTADQPFETCEWYVNNATIAEVPRNEVDDCYSSTTVYPLASAPVTIVKGVRGVGAGPLDENGTPIDSDPVTPGVQPYDDLGILKTVPASAVNCNAPNVSTGVVAEYYRYPCVPITRPGSIEEWASTFTNGGNIGLTQIVAIDVLPAPGDRGVIVNEARGSKWTPTLTTYPQIINLPVGATFDVYYVTDRAIASQRCNGADIQATLGMVPGGSPVPMTPGYTTCYTDAAPVDSVANRNAAWTLLSPTADAATLASVVAMKFVISMQASSPLTPGERVSVTYQSQTSSVIGLAETGAEIDNQSIAYNSIAAAAAGYDPSDPLVLIPNRFVTEPRKVGVAMATGAIELSKVVTGGAASRSQSSFTINVDCVSAGTVLPTRQVSVAKNSSVVVHGLPLYAECAISESSSYNQNPNTSSISPSTVVAQAPQTAGIETILDPNPIFGPDRPAIEVSTITNDYPLTTFDITKTLNINGALDAEVGGNPVYPSDLRFSASCTFNNGSTNVTVLNVSNLDFDPGSGTQTYTSPEIPVGSVCTVTETASRGAQSTTRVVTVNGVVVASGSGTSATFTVDDTGNSVAFTNTYGVASLTLNKIIDGAWATTAATPAHTTGEFTVSVVCTRQLNVTPALETTFSGTVTFSAATTLTHTIDNIAQGSNCTISETGTAGATRVAITTTGGATGSVVSGISGTQTRNITNYFDLASLTVTKQVHTDAVDTDGNVVYLDAPYTVNVSCTFQGNQVFATGYSASPMVLTFSEADMGNAKTASSTLTGLPAGASCSVSESPTPGNADSVRVDWNTAATSGTAAATTAIVGPLTANGAADAVTNVATVHNYYEIGHFTVSKALRGDAASAFGLGPFTVHIECISGGVTTYDGDITLTPTHLTETIDNLAVGSVCSAVETGTGRSTPDAVVYIDAFGDPADGAGVDVMSSNPLVTIENWYLTGSVSVTKQVVESAGYTFGTGPFEIELSCSRDVTGPAETITTTVSRTMNPAVPSSMTQVFGDLPNGAMCTLTETDDGSAASTTITNGTVTSSVASTGITFTVELDETILSTVDQAQPAITVTNTFTEATLSVTKRVSSDALDAQGDPLEYGPFPVGVSCTFNGSAVYGDGYSAATPMTRQLAHDETWTIEGLPTGASCSVTEDDVMDAVATSITTQAGGGITTTETVSQNPVATVPDASLVLGPAPSVNSVVFTNFYETGSIELSKQLLGLAAAQWGTADFTVDVTCEYVDSTTRASNVVFEGQFDRAALTGATAPLIEKLPSGAICEIEETTTGTATAVEFVVTDPSTGTPVTTPGTIVTVPVGNSLSPIDVVANNTFDYTSITVQKLRAGDPTGLYDVGPFEVSLACTFDGVAIDEADIADGLVRELTASNSYYATYTGLPVGADCELTETKWGASNSTEMSIGVAGAPVAGRVLGFETESSPTEVYVTNTYEVGSLRVTKSITGPGSFLYGDGSALYGLTGFEVTIACTRDVDGVETPVALPYTPSYTLTAAESYEHTFEQLPAGAECSVSETKKGFAATSTVGAPVTIVADVVGVPTATEIEVVNDFQLGSIMLSKQSLGVFAARADGSVFEVTVECWQDVDGTPVKVEPIKDGEVRTISAGEQIVFEELPVPAECTFDETVNGGADLAVYSITSFPIFGSTITVDPSDLDVGLDNYFVLAHNGSDVDLWIIGALISLLSGVCLVVIGRRRERTVRARVR